MLWDSFSHLLHNRMEPFKFHSPMSIAIYAPPYSGKSTLTRKILEHGDELFTTPPCFTVYCYKEWLPMFDEMKHSVKGLILHKGVPSREQVEKWAQGKHFILVLDDLQQVCEKDREVAEMFTVGSHHLNFTLIYLCHNIFSKGCFSRLINLNSHYNILFRNIIRHITSSNSWTSDIWETMFLLYGCIQQGNFPSTGLHLDQFTSKD